MRTISKLFYSLIAVSLIAAACSPSPSAKIARSSKQREVRPSIQQGQVESVVNGNNAFAFNLYQSLRASTGNLIFSPFSISLALAMTYAGARGETETQMADTLHFDLPGSQLHPAFNALDLGLEASSNTSDEGQEPLELNIVNAAWVEQTFDFLQEYLDLIAVNYGAGIQLADFINQFETVRKQINDWVSDRTNGRIKDLIPEGALNPDTRMVLVNAIYFKADWLDQFDANDTHDAPFHLLDGSEVTAKTMSQGMFIPYAGGDGYQAIELPYAGGTAAMDIIVPDEGNFEPFEAALTADKLYEILGNLQETSVMLSLPKFSFTSEFNLSDTLAALGMSDAFDRGKADFSGITGSKDLFISDVIHKAFVAVDEEGTEAAAATAVILEATSAPMYDVVLQVDRPFIFLIRDLPSGQILFIGRVLNPEQ